MRRQEGFMHNVTNQAPASISPWQLPFGTKLDSMLRAGTAPPQEDYNLSRKSKQTTDTTTKLFAFPTRPQSIRNPVKLYPNPFKTSTKSRKNEKSPHMSPERTGRYEKDIRQSKLRLGELEDDSEGSHSDIEISRPPSRQNDKAFDLEDRFFTRLNGFMHNPKEQPEIRPTRNTISNPRPPSRHKTPPKATGLELPPHPDGDFISIQNMYDFHLSSDSEENEPYANTQTIFTEKSKGSLKESWKKLENKCETKQKMKSIKEDSDLSIKIPSKAETSLKKNNVEIPIILNKRIKKWAPISPGRRAKSKDFETEDKLEERKSEIKIEKKSKRKGNKLKEKPGRAVSSASKPKPRESLTFLSSLGSEFLDLFARDNDFM
ncbi:unnamed protein product [Blepharisma stoltei]|uniref:Uncharacterized protein n=1 Tax=Blepharisma stoltei TaxID=1481888 RepID=A0AAU9IIB0_9CILI|nr:unnamed protein product [Blepharisma stoltei]